VRVESRIGFSPSLGHDLEHRVYGHGGQPLVAFSSMNGRFYDFENFGMVDGIARFLEAGRLTLYTLDSIDWQSWTNAELHPSERARRHEAYDRYVASEFIPLVREEMGRATTWVTGCSMGAYHASNFFFRHPDLADGLIAISGVYQVRRFIGDFVDDGVYFNSPLLYLPNLDDQWYLERYRRSQLAFCIGQGRWEEECLAETRAMQAILDAKQVPATFDYWGYDVDHDWPWWRRMLPHQLERLGI